MNYTINYPTTGVSTTISNPVAVQPNQGQRTIVLSPPSANCSTSGHTVNKSNSPQSFPMVMQVGSSNTPVFYYQSNDGIVAKMTESVNPGIGQLVLSPVSPVQSGINIIKQNASSPNISSLNIASDGKSSVVRSLGDVFNIQAMPGIGGAAPIGTSVVGNTPLCSNGNQSSPDLANLISSLQAAGLQIVETGRGATSNCSGISVINNSQQNDAGQHSENPAIRNFVTSLQASGLPIVENQAENTLSISLPSSGVTTDKMYKIVDGGGNVTVITTSDSTEQVAAPATPDVTEPSSNIQMLK